MKKFYQISLVCIGIYFIITLPLSIIQYVSRYSDYDIGNCIFDDYNIESNDGLYQLNSNLTVNNCTQELSICCNDFNYWKNIISNNNTKCYYNKECEIIPEFIKYTSFNIFQISSFIFGALLALNIIVYCELNRKKIYIENENECEPLIN
jgi:hypothetical protein